MGNLWSKKYIKRLIWLLALMAIVSGLFLGAAFILSATSAQTQTDSLVQNQKPINPTPSPVIKIPTPIPTPTLPPIPTKKVISGGTHTFQTFNNCGPASLSMALSYYGITKSQAELGNQLRPYQNQAGDNDDKSVTLKELAKKAEELGLTPYHRPAGDMEIIEKFIALDIPVITRTWLKPDDTIGHYRVIKGYDQKRQTILQDDSLQGKDLEYGYQEFNDIWQAFNYEYLVLVPFEKEAEVKQILAENLDETTAWQKALGVSEKQRQQNPNDVYAKFNQSVALYHLGRYQESISLFETIESDLPFRMLWYQIEPIKAYYQLGQYNRVIDLTNSIINNHNRAFSELHYIQGQIYQLQNQPELAQASFDKADFYHPYSDIWQVNLK